MSHLPPADETKLVTLAPFLAAAEASMGFVPNSTKAMANRPQLAVAFSLLYATVMGVDLKALLAHWQPLLPDAAAATDNLNPELRHLISFATSLRSGCLYCQAHTSHSLERASSSPDQAKFDQVLNYQQADCYSDAERAVLDLVFASTEQPNAATADHFNALQAHFNEAQVAQMVAMMATFGFLNRWNDTLATPLEAMPLQFAEAHLQAFGWQGGKHVAVAAGDDAPVR